MDSDEFNPDDHGQNMDSASASHDNPSTSYDDPGIHAGPSDSSQHLRCVNCGLNITRTRRHLLEIVEVRNLIKQWVRSQQPGDKYEIQLVNSTILKLLDINKCALAVAAGFIFIIISGWRRTDRATSRSTAERQSELSSPSLSQSSQSEVSSNVLQAGQPRLDTTSDSIVLPNYVRAPNTQNQCFFPGCSESNRLIVPSALRVHLFCEYNYYVPPDCRICYYHLTSNSWDLLLQSIYNPIKIFSAAQIEDFACLLKDNMQNHIDFENIHYMPEHIIHYYLGLTKAQYQQILLEVPRLSNKHRGSFALAAYLMKLRTGDSDERMSALLQVPRSTLERLMNMAREILNQDFVPRNLGINHISRAEIAQRNLTIPNGLYGGGERRPIIIADDRGFRDSLALLEHCGYHVHVPLSPEVGKSQLTTRAANTSRAVTMCRWVVEVVNGIFKTAFKIFRQNYFNRASKHVMIDFSVAAALINKFHKRLRDRDDAAEILERVNLYMETENDLSDYVRQRNLNRARTDFRNISVNLENVREFPLLTYSELILFACGVYQLKQARSYYGEHIRFNGCYHIEVCNDHRSSIMDGLNFGPNCSLLRARIASRHMDKDKGNALFKYSRGKRIAQRCLNETPPYVSNTSCSMADIVTSCAFEGAENSSDSLTLLDFETVIPNDKVILTPTKYSDVQAIGNGHTLSQSNTDELPLHLPQSSSKPSSSVPTLAIDINDNSRTQANNYYFPSDAVSATVYSATSFDFLLIPINPSVEVFQFNTNRHNIHSLDVKHLEEMGLTEVENVYIKMIDAHCLQDITNNEPLVLYSSSESDGELPIKSKSRNKKTKVDCKIWFAEKNTSLRENGQKYYGRVKICSKWTYKN
ncbi:unnamed protein product [Euphydryas editha]|uniref:DDE Tnp4 domain-containing protein n=1 Tax=Euphydryas editha TaxID=104508 RepID=A0AAU9VCV8_EUPED|nr:unnamed protein product [Euphydryas editha]